MPCSIRIFSSYVLVVPLFPILISACSNKASNNEAKIKALEESLINSNIVINRSTKGTMYELQNKVVEYASKERATFWEPKAKKAVTLSKEIYDYIEGLKTEKYLVNEKSAALYNRLLKYQEEIFNIDSAIRQNFTNSIILISKAFDSQNLNEKDFYNTFFNTVSEVSTSAILSKLQNNIKIIENKITGFCNLNVGQLDGAGFFNSYAAIVGQNSNYLKPGDELEIKAGVGAFSKAAQPKININGNNLKLEDEGYALFKIKTPRIPGKYKIPVNISYFNQTTGKEDTMMIDVEYTVAKECNQ